jgi:hypothetical protein
MIATAVASRDEEPYIARRCCEEIFPLPNLYSITLGYSHCTDESIVFMNTLSKFSTARIFNYTDFGNSNHRPLLPDWNLKHINNFNLTLNHFTRHEYSCSILASRVTAVRTDLTVSAMNTAFPIIHKPTHIKNTLTPEIAESSLGTKTRIAGLGIRQSTRIRIQNGHKLHLWLAFR